MISWCIDLYFSGLRFSQVVALGNSITALGANPGLQCTNGTFFLERGYPQLYEICPIACGICTGESLVSMRVQIIRHCKTCMTDIYLQNECAHVGLSVHAPVCILQGVLHSRLLLDLVPQSAAKISCALFSTKCSAEAAALTDADGGPGYVCGPCPTGYQGTGHKDMCVDINDCLGSPCGAGTCTDLGQNTYSCLYSTGRRALFTAD